MKKKAQKRYDREFKLGAVRLVVEEGKSIAQVANDLGISDKSLYTWVAQFKADAEASFPGSGKLKPQDDELKRLREEVRILRMERDLLKKTLPLFMEARK
jgi:transposase